MNSDSVEKPRYVRRGIAAAFALAAASALGGCAIGPLMADYVAPPTGMTVVCTRGGAEFIYKDASREINLAGHLFTDIPEGGASDVVYIQGQDGAVDVRARYDSSNALRPISGGPAGMVHSGIVDLKAISVDLQFVGIQVDSAFVRQLAADKNCALAVGGTRVPPYSNGFRLGN